MTVEELIYDLQQCHDDAEVLICNKNYQAFKIERCTKADCRTVYLDMGEEDVSED